LPSLNKRRLRNDISIAVKAINRAALVNVPVVGPIITELMGVYGDEYKRRQLDALAEELNTVMKLVEGNVDRQFLESDDFAALVMRVMRDSLQTTDRKKIRYLAAVLAGSATTERIDPLEVEALLNALSQLTSIDMVLARSLIGRAVNPLEGDSLPNVVPNPWFHAARLESAGFIERSTNGIRFRTAPYVPSAALTQLMKMIGPLLSEP
jgi:hypothetical protein